MSDGWLAGYPMLCGGRALVKRSAGYARVQPALCRCWTCEVCRPRRQARVEIEIEAGRPDAHLVLTLRRTPGASAITARKRLGKAIPEFFRRLERQTGQHVERYNVIEATKAGWPHAHIACQGWRFGHHSKLKAMWRQITGDSDHVRIRRVPVKRMKKYLAKYLGKDLHKFGDGKRYWRTKGWLPADFGKPTNEDLEQWQGWKFEREHPEEVIHRYRREGWFSIQLGQGEAVLTPPPWPCGRQTGPPECVW